MFHSPKTQNEESSTKGISCTLAELYLEGQKSKKQSLHLRKKSRAHLQGLNRSSTRGRGMEFLESRPYVPQDEIRSIDWKLYARYNSLFTKIYVEEKNRPSIIVVDFRPNMHFGTKQCFKSVLAAKVAARLLFAGLHGQDQIGLLLANGQEVKYLPPAKNQKQLSLALGLLASFTQKTSSRIKPRPDFWDEVLRLLRKIPAGSQSFLLSDFLDFGESHKTSILRLLRKTDIFALKISDPLEESLPNLGELGLSYSGESIIINSFDKAFLENYQKLCLNNSKSLEKIFNNLGIPLIHFSTAAKISFAFNKFLAGNW